MKKLLFVMFVLWVGGGAGVWYWNEGRPQQVGYRTVKMTKGDLLATINATGTLEPVEVVDIGAQIAGEIQSFGPDPKDSSRTISHGSNVEQGTVLAKLDDKLCQTRVSQCRANLAKAEGDVEQADVKAKHAQRELLRAQRLLEKHQISAQELDTITSDSDSAKAMLAVAQGSLALAKANLEEASVNLGYTTIRSPVKGVIVDRRVNLGQMVVASLNSSLFLIAKDLSKMEIWASVNETDVGQIHPGQKVKFNVAAFPRETFFGKVSQIRLNASMTQSVVTYTVVVDVDNPDGKLLPYLTARLQFEVQERRDARLAPNAALRWTPAVVHVVPAYRTEFSQTLRRRAGLDADKAGAKDQKSYDRKGTLWVRDGNFVRPVPVSVGLTDGINSEITEGDVSDGLEAVVGLAQNEEDRESTSPFLPQIKNDKAKK